MPDPEADLLNYAADLITAYTNCAVLHNQCRAALANPGNPTLKGN